jgi:RHS Repeat.
MLLPLNIKGGLTTTYDIDALGQRVSKVSTGGTSPGETFYHYDTQGRLIGESNPQGEMIRDYLWLYDIPVGVMQ